MDNKFLINVKTKPYIKRYVQLTYGLPADFTNHPKINKDIKRCLRKPDSRYEKTYENRLCSYTESLPIFISQDDFYRYGWELTRTDTVYFGKIFEHDIKFNMHIMVTTFIGVGMTTKKAISEYQRISGLEEEYWSYESIKKEYYRKNPNPKISYFTPIVNRLQEIFMGALSLKRDNVLNKKPSLKI